MAAEASERGRHQEVPAARVLQELVLTVPACEEAAVPEDAAVLQAHPEAACQEAAEALRGLAAAREAQPEVGAQPGA